jgi:hypothetical protein
MYMWAPSVRLWLLMMTTLTSALTLSLSLTLSAHAVHYHQGDPDHRRGPWARSTPQDRKGQLAALLSAGARVVCALDAFQCTACSCLRCRYVAVVGCC